MFRASLLKLAAIAAVLAFSPIARAQTTSPFPPPTANDYTFVVNSGAGLDTGCTFRSGGPLRIRLPIGRVLGILATLKANGLVPATVRVEFPAFDVDSAGVPGFPPERDRVSINGNVVPGEFMSGINNVWIMQRFDVPIEWLMLPTEPASVTGTVTPADNEIRIDIDTASGSDENWCTAVDWVTITIDNPIPPRPWIGAHGIFSEGSIWNGLWVPNIRALGLPAGPGPDMGRLDSIQNNATKIATAVSQARARWGVDRVNIVAHSKGGLDSREYLENRNTVEKLVQLGTPNAGSPLADVLQSGTIVLLGGQGNIIANLLAGGVGGYQLTTPYMSVYNSFHGSNPKVTYMAIGGLQTPGGFFSDPGGRILQAIVGPGDLIVPLTSVHRLPFTLNRTVFSTFPPTFGPASHIGIHQNGAAFSIAQSLVTAPGLTRPSLGALELGALKTNPLTRQVLTAVNGPTNPALQHTETFGGKLQQPQTANHVIAVDSASTMTFALLHPEGNLDLRLTDPNGQVFDASTIVGLPDVSRQEVDIPGGLIEVFTFTGSFALGNWTASVMAKNTTGPVDYNVTAWLENAPLQMTAAIDRLSVPIGGSFRLAATLMNGSSPVAGATVRASIRLPDGLTSQIVALRDDGSMPDLFPNDGIYTGNFSGTSQAGPYGIAVDASGSGSTPFSRETYLAAFVTTSTSTILGGITDSGRDLNGNGLFDQLLIHVPVQITAAGTYRLAATFVDSSGNVLESSNSFALSVGTSIVDLPFDGTTLFAHGVNGPYQITSIRMAEELNQVLLPLTETTSTYNTGPYLYTQFEGSSLALTGANSAIGVDTNANGKFDLLQTDIGVNVRRSAFYQWSARLRDQNGREITLASGSGNLTAGITSVRLLFDGSAIGRNGVDGPFEISDLLLFSPPDTLSVASVFSSPPIPASAFEGFVVSLGPPRITGATQSFTSIGSGQYRMQLRLTNSGLGLARNTFLRSLSFRILTGPAGTPITLAGPTLPIFVGDLNPGAATSTVLILNVPAGVRRFSITENGTLADSTGAVSAFSIGQSVLIP